MDCASNDEANACRIQSSETCCQTNSKKAQKKIPSTNYCTVLCPRAIKIPAHTAVGVAMALSRASGFGFPEIILSDQDILRIKLNNNNRNKHLTCISLQNAEKRLQSS